MSNSDSFDLTDAELIDIRKTSRAADPTKPWGDSLAFARKVIDAYKARNPQETYVSAGFVLQWPRMGGGRTEVFHDTDIAAKAIGCPYDQVFKRVATPTETKGNLS